VAARHKIGSIYHGFEDDLRDAGAVPVSAFRDIRYERPDVGVLPQRDLGPSFLCASRPLTESVLRRRAASVPNIALLSQCRVTDIAPVSLYANRQSVKFENCTKCLATIEADLVVDASGRCTPTLALLDALGLKRPDETVVGVDISYTTALLPRPAEADRKLVVTLADPPRLVRGGLILPIEDGRCFVTIFEHGATERPRTWADFLAILRQLNTPTIYDSVCDLPPPEHLRHFVFDESRWRHFESLRYLPQGVLPFADAICRFNPVYGQGMTIAALQAKLLRDCLVRATAEAHPISATQTQFMSEVGNLLQTPWNMGVSADFAYPSTRGEPPEGYGEGRRFEAALFRATVADPIVQAAFSDVIQLIKPFEHLQRPDIRRRIEAHSDETCAGTHHRLSLNLAT
jgi:hypothetical protein